MAIGDLQNIVVVILPSLHTVYFAAFRAYRKLLLMTQLLLYVLVCEYNVSLCALSDGQLSKYAYVQSV